MLGASSVVNINSEICKKLKGKKFRKKNLEWERVDKGRQGRLERGGIFFSADFLHILW